MTAVQEPIFLHLNADFPDKIIDLVEKFNINMVYWDLGGTLVDLSPSMKERAVKKINIEYHRQITVEMYDEAIRMEWMRRETREAKNKIKSVDDDTKEKKYWIEFYSCVLINLGIRARNQRIVKWLATVQSNPNSFEELPFVRDTLDKLRGENVAVGIISNAFPSARKILENKGLIKEFHEQHVILSYEYNINSIKPEKAIYKKAIKRAKVKPHQILFIDDRKSFVDGAARHGMKAVVVNDSKGRPVSGSGIEAFARFEFFVKIVFSVISSFIFKQFCVPWVNGIKQDFYAARAAQDFQGLPSFAGGRSPRA